MKMRYFDHTDYDGFAGVEETPECQALIGELWCDGYEGTVIVDTTGIEITWLIGEMDDPITTTMKLKGTYALGKFVANNLPPAVNYADLMAMGFERID